MTCRQVPFGCYLPLMSAAPPIPVSSFSAGDAEERLLLQCLREGWVSSRGPWVERFEHAVAECAGRRFGVAVSNGSAALEVALAALGIGPGDEVLLPAHTIISCAFAVLRLGATPVLVDSDPEHWCLDASALAGRVTAQTRAILVPHLYGLPADMAAVAAAAERCGIKVIEDAAQMIGAQCQGAMCGSFGTLSTFSFFANKNVTTGEGGMVVTDDPDLAQRARDYRDLGAQPNRRFVHEELGWNYRLGSLSAALGLAQLEGLDERLHRKRAIGLRYRELLSDQPNLILPPPAVPHGPNSYWAAGMLLCDTADNDVDTLLRQLAWAGIEARPFFWPLHLQPVFARQGRFLGERYPVAETLGRSGFYLPCGADLSDGAIQRVCNTLRLLLKERRSVRAQRGEMGTCGTVS